MTSKKQHPLFDKTKNKAKSSPRKAQLTKPRPKKWLIAILIVPIFIFAYLFLSQPSTDTIVTPMVSPPSTQPLAATPSTTSSIENTAALDAETVNNPSLVDDTAINSTTQTPGPNAKAILNAPIPETNSLAKEEIDRLADQRQRLAEQEKLAAEQIAISKNLTEMKAEQIELLEQQIMQLEAEKGTQ